MYCLLVFLKFREHLSTSDNYPEELIQSLENDQISDNLTYYNLDTREVIMNEQRMTGNYQIYPDFPSINLQTDSVGNNDLNILHNANINYDGIFDSNDHTGLQKQSNNKNEIGINSIQNNNTKIILNSVDTDFDMGLDESEHRCKSHLSRNQTKRCHNKKKAKCKMHVQDSQLTINKESSKNKVKHFRSKLKFLTLPPNLEILDISKFNKSEDTDYLDKIQVENGEKNSNIFDESKKNEQNLLLKRKRNNLSYKKAIGKRNENDQMVNSGILTFDLKKLEEKNFKTFQGRGKLDENKRIDLDLFEKINIVKLIKDLEDEFPIRFNKIYHHLTSEEFPKKCFLKQSECNKEDFETLLNFTNKYIFNKTLRTVFMKENDKLSYSYVFKKSKKDMISKILKQFNLTMKNFVEDLEKFYLKRCENYFQPLKIIFFTKNKNILRKKLIWFFEMFLKSPKMKIITYLFPEIHLFIDELRKDKCVRILYKKVHLIISLLGFRTYLLSENLKHVFDSNKLNPSFVFTDSNFVNFFVFEMRCFLCLCGFKVLKEKTAIRFLLYKTFISFIRISNIDVFRGTKFDDYISYKDFMDLGIPQNVKLKKIRKPNDIYTEGTCYEIRTLLKTDFDKFLKLKDKSMQTRFSEKNDELKEYYENTIFENKIQEITHEIFQYFERIN